MIPLSVLDLAPIPEGSTYRRRIHAFIESLRYSKAKTPAAPVRGILDIALASMEAMQSTVTRLRLAAYSPDVMVEIPRNACGLLEFWRAEPILCARAR